MSNPGSQDWHDAPSSDTTRPSPPPQARKLSELVRPNSDDPNEFLLHRFLCNGGGLLLAGPTGVGKSALALQCAVLWAINQPCFGITPRRSLRSLFVQAENDDGDLAEMRDGILDGLNFTPGQSANACENVLIACEDRRTGFLFFSECLCPLLAEHKPDLLWVDPALSYLGGESNSQRDVGTFLRSNLNPSLHKYNCSGIVITHTNKPPTGREKPDWSGSDFAYLGTGSAEWANWARAVLAIRSTGQSGIFELRAGKRGSRIGWKDDNGETSYARFIGHSPGCICWREVDAAELNRTGRPKFYDPEEIFDLLPPEGLETEKWAKLANQECGVSKSTFHRERRAFEKAGRILKSKISDKWQPC